MGLREVGLGQCHVSAEHRQVSVPHKPLKFEEVAPGPEKRHCEGVAQRVRAGAQFLGKPGQLTGIPHDLVTARVAQAAATLVPPYGHEQGIVGTGEPPFRFQVAPERPSGRGRHVDGALLVPLPDHREGAVAAIHVPDAQTDRLGDPL